MSNPELFPCRDRRIRGVDDEMALAGSDADLALELLEKRQDCVDPVPSNCG